MRPVLMKLHSIRSARIAEDKQCRLAAEMIAETNGLSALIVEHDVVRKLLPDVWLNPIQFNSYRRKHSQR